MKPETLKKQAALRAVTHVHSGMVVGLGTGSTASYAIAELGAKLSSGELVDITAVATSEASTAQAKSLNIPLGELTDKGVDVAIDGMDELDPALNAIKGLGGALTREKIVAARARCFILIGDSSKRVTRLGEKAPIPVEVIPFGWQAARAELAALGCTVSVRQQKQRDAPFISDNGNLILDCHFEQAFDAHDMAAAMTRLVGVVEHGLFLNMAHLAYVATPEGVVELSR